MPIYDISESMMNNVDDRKKWLKSSQLTTRKWIIFVIFEN